MSRMRCPLGHSELEHYTKTNRQGIATSYQICPRCGGYWTSGFDANYLERIGLESVPAIPHVSDKKLVCPDCTKPLIVIREDAVPSDVTIFGCPDNHGYFFPRGELKKFKDAQNAKITYHKLWHIPLPPLSKVLLVGLFLFLVGSSAIVLTRIQEAQHTSLKAKEMIAYQEAVATKDPRSLLFLARTSRPTSLTLHIDSLSLTGPMSSTDGLSHTLKLTDIGGGFYEYYFSYTTDDQILFSPTYTVSVP